MKIASLIAVALAIYLIADSLRDNDAIGTSVGLFYGSIAGLVVFICWRIRRRREE
ncbi:MAG: hypothetical protein AB7G28_07845 [Pirellulales bacterium]